MLCVVLICEKAYTQEQLYRRAPPRTFVSNNYARDPRHTAQQSTTVVYNTGYSQTPIYYHGNASTTNNGQQQPINYVTVNDPGSTSDGGSGVSALQDTRYDIEKYTV